MKDYKHRMTNLKKLFENPLPSARSGAFFNAFSYPTKISPESIAVYIASITEPGETVLDAFGGSGSTGIAALLCEHPTDNMKAIAKRIGVKPKWGRRNAICYEIGSYGSFAMSAISNRLSSKSFEKAVDDYIGEVEGILNKYYSAIDPDGNEGLIRHIIWTEYLICPNCKEEISYFEFGTKRNPVTFLKEIKCPKCGKKHVVDDLDFAKEEHIDKVLGEKCQRKKRRPAWIYGTTGAEKWNRKATDRDYTEYLKVEEKLVKEKNPSKIEWGELHRSGYHYGIDYLHQFYTSRNYYVFKELWKRTEKYDEKVQAALKLLLLSYNGSNCTMMTRVVAKKDSKDFVLTGAQSGVLYISKLPVEKNILLGLKRKSAPISEAYKMLENCSGNFFVRNTSSAHMEEKNNTIDYVFTDPPFGDFIPYAEVNQINELWLDNRTNRDDEIIISQSQNKGLNEYKQLLESVFKEICRVLKDDAYATVVFHAAKADVWAALANVISDSGMKVALTNILDKKQASFKQVVSNDSVQGDPLLLLQKGKMVCVDKETDEDIISRLMNEQKNEKINERRIYSLYVNECLIKGRRVSMDASQVYAIIRGRKKNGTK